ncbi:MAG TPA: PKD domain-containing protein, partial [Chitinophagaceae bacterium]|nr:PKD domain-containing protein [Chitinophagaceae bacterium]
LPPAQPAFIWYPYDVSPDFPQVGTGGRNAMAGPVYYTDMFPKETRLPDYYNGKLFIYDWIRGWIKTVTMLPNCDFDKMEPFMEHIKLSNCIDMEVGPDGKLYLLEYGTGWFAKNPDAGLSRIDYTAGNRAPEIASLKVDKATGSLPFKGRATVDVKDPEDDKLTYIWDPGNGKKQETTTPEFDFNYTTAGDYKISVEVKDAQGASSKSDPVEVYAGNETPVVNIKINYANKSFYLPGKPINYSVTVTDKDDTSKIDPANLFVSVDYVPGLSKSAAPTGHQQEETTVSGKNIMLSLDCKSCHKENEKSIGPSFMQVAQKYAKDPNAMTYLTEKIIKGGGGVWGDVQMAAHPTLAQSDVQQIVQWVFSLANQGTIKKSLPASGTITPPANTKPNASLVLSASYTDKGGNNIKALTGRNIFVLNSNTVLFTGKEKTKGFTNAKYNDINYMVMPKEEGWFSLDSIDLTGIMSANIMMGWQDAPVYGYDFELRLDAPDGKSPGKGSLLPPQNKSTHQGMAHIALQTVTDNQYHTIYIIAKPRDSKEKAQAGIGAVQFNAK